MSSVSFQSQSGAPLISVVMTTYNGERFVAEQIDSILDQTFNNFELIVADDASTDETVERLSDCAARDPRIRLVLNTSNLGVHKNLESAFLMARGEFIAIADQDDIWAQDKLETLVKHVGSKAAIYSNSLLTDEMGTPTGLTLMQRLNIKRPADGDQALLLLRKSCVSGHALMFRKSLLQCALPFFTGLMYDQQISFAAALGDGLVYLDKPLVRHRIHDTNQNNGELNMARSAPRMARVARARKQSLELAEKLRYFHAYCLRVEGKQQVGSRLPKLLHFAPEIANRFSNFDKTWFDFRLFFLLLWVRREFFYGDDAGVVRRCMKYAKGAKAYAQRQLR